MQMQMQMHRCGGLASLRPEDERSSRLNLTGKRTI